MSEAGHQQLSAANKMRRAETLAHDGQLKEALLLLQQLNDALPAGERPWLQTCRVLAQMGRAEEAETYLKSALVHLPEDPSLLMEFARLAENRFLWAEAAQRWELVRKKFPQQPHAWVGGSASHAVSGNIDAAEALITEAVGLFPADAGVAFAWAEFPRWRSSPAERAQRWTEVRKSYPGNPGAYAAGALALIDAGRLVEAESVALEGSAKFPSDRDMQRACGIVLTQVGKLEDAESALQEALRIDPRDPTSHFYGIVVASARGDWKQANERVSVAKRLFPTDKRFDEMARDQRHEAPGAASYADGGADARKAPLPTRLLRRLARRHRSAQKTGRHPPEVAR